jgi:ABC-type dipeptide/oligopeptide/nickel transport system permease subunit
MRNIEPLSLTEEKNAFWRELRYAVWWLSRSRAAIVGIVLVGSAIVVALLGPSISPHSYQEMNLSVRLQPPLWMEGGNWEYPLGTDDLGRCLLSRIIYAIRIAFIVGGTVTVLTSTVGVLLGLISGYFGRLTDIIIMRLVDVQWSFPYLMLAIAVMALLGTRFINLILVLMISGWVSYARTVRGLVMSLKEEDFVTAAISVGMKPARIIFRHILPNTMAAVLVLASFNLANIILMEASLSFLGLGVQPPIPSLGGMISGSREYLYTAWWLVSFPGLALMILVLGVNQLGDGLRDLLDPRLRGVL